jgi:lipopolysaccharide biosynthesis glycosyltransferase
MLEHIRWLTGHLWQVLFLDSDMLVMGNIDALFELNAPAAMSYAPFDSDSHGAFAACSNTHG